MTTNEIKPGDMFRIKETFASNLPRDRMRIGEVIEVARLDQEGRPIFVGERDTVASRLFLRNVPDFLERVEPDDAPDSVTLGACYRDPRDGEIVRVIEIDPGPRTKHLSGPVGTSDADTWASARFFRGIFSERVPDPTPAVVETPAPSTEDRKPRGVKPALALIPWEVVPDRLVPEVVRESTDPARVIEILLDTQGDAFLDDVARAFEHGAAKYGRDNWRTIEWTDTARREYESAMLRHLYADAIGERNDPDSGVSHLAHACASAMIHTFHTRKARA